MLYDQKEFLDLLQPWTSEETKRSRRALILISFIVISIWLLEIKITNVRLFGVDLSQSTEVPVLCIALSLLSFWAVMFQIHRVKDQETQYERARLLDSVISKFVGEYERYATVREKQKHAYVPPDFHKTKAAVEAYNSQQERTVKLGRIHTLLSSIDVFLPYGLAALSAAILISGIAAAL